MTRIHHRADEIARGITDAELRRHCANGTMLRLARGSYLEASDAAGLTDVDTHLLRARAVMHHASASDTVLSHVSAAVLHGIQVWNVPLGKVHVTRNRRTGGRSTRTRHVHASPYDPSEVTVVDGLPVTTPARTVADLACSVPFEEAVCAADDAGRRFGVTGAEVETILARHRTRTHHARALRVARLLDPASESVGESRSRVLLHERGFEPRTQQRIVCGSNVYRADFLLSTLRVIGEFDGRIKYGRLVPAGAMPEDVLWREKLREDDFRDAGYGVARWGWSALYTPDVIVERILRAASRAQRP